MSTVVNGSLCEFCGRHHHVLWEVLYFVREVTYGDVELGPGCDVYDFFCDKCLPTVKVSKVGWYHYKPRCRYSYQYLCSRVRWDNNLPRDSYGFRRKLVVSDFAYDIGA